MRINTNSAVTHSPIEAKASYEKKAVSYEANPVSPCGSASSIASSNDKGSEETLIESAKLEKPEYEVVERNLDLFSFPVSANDDALEIPLDPNGLNILFYNNCDTDASEKLFEVLGDASKRSKRCNKVVRTSWAKKQFLSADEITSLKEEVEQASKLLTDIYQICKDAQHIKNQINWIEEPIVAFLSSEAENQEIALLQKEFITLLSAQVVDSISVHIRNVAVVQNLIEQYIDKSERFLALDENTPPKPSLLERVSFIVTAMPGLLGGLGVALAYIVGATAALSFLPLAAGGIGSCLGLLFLSLNAAKLAPTERIRQLTEERIELNQHVFKPVLDLLKKASKMNSGVGGGITDAVNRPATFETVYRFNKPIKDDTKALLEGNAGLQTSLGELLGEVRDLKRSVAPLLRDRKTSTTSLSSNSSNSSSGTESVTIGRSETNSPDFDKELINRDEVKAIVKEALKEKEEKHAKELAEIREQHQKSHNEIKKSQNEMMEFLKARFA